MKIYRVNFLSRISGGTLVTTIVANKENRIGIYLHAMNNLKLEGMGILVTDKGVSLHDSKHRPDLSDFWAEVKRLAKLQGTWA